ncbi:MAG: hypothetical protein JSR82_22310 [Verrucomicrobia bacterium]|nr:hypothetical protein [Verrucomicrobiota bacterium]
MSARSPSADAVTAWLLEGDPALRWQVLRDLQQAPPDVVAAERARVGREGLGAALLAQQRPDGTWGGTAWNHGWDSTMHALTLLREFGLDPASDEARRAVALVREQVHWEGWDWDGTWRGPGFVGAAYFAGEVEPCINGQVATSGAYFGQDVQRIVDRLLREQLADGGWNCEAERGSVRSSFHTTICVLEALLACERAGGAGELAASRRRGEDYLLERRLLRRRTTGEWVDDAFTRLSFPNWWRYDVLRALDHLRLAGVRPDERAAEAVALLLSKRAPDGRWSLERFHEGTMPVDLGEQVGQPSRWLTFRALRVLDWYHG